ncbi:trigger factor-like [Dioscorea cayenensis subsp. rotundata]|uniref:peptidylprolyl isomerase n=1 Tax=Dioscorea cayennensis subsp. rotundata TaxID=55577 RepID=A0AB40AWW6_DIOCR|nr:trigger factor-like [Dioscorea cayenensis subsp. rotundata]
MASMVMTTLCSHVSFHWNQPLFPQVMFERQGDNQFPFKRTAHHLTLHAASGVDFGRLSTPSGRTCRHMPWPVFAVGSGYEASISDQKKKDDISVGDVKIVIESRDDDKIQVRVDLTGEQTQKAFDDVLTNMARTAPPIPGFRRTKGGKTSNVPKSFLLQILGKDRVTKFLIEEIVSITVGDFVKKENLKVKSQFKTTQTADELESAFTPGSEFSFNATMELLKTDAEAANSSST